MALMVKRQKQVPQAISHLVTSCTDPVATQPIIPRVPWQMGRDSHCSILHSLRTCMEGRGEGHVGNACLSHIPHRQHLTTNLPAIFHGRPLSHVGSEQLGSAQSDRTFCNCTSRLPLTSFMLRHPRSTPNNEHSPSRWASN